MNERWEWNGPEEGDEVDLAVVIMFDGEEVMVLHGDMDDLADRKLSATKLCERLNGDKWEGLV